MRLALLVLFLSIGSVCFGEEVIVNVNKTIEPSDLTEELMSAFPSSGVHGIIYDKATKEVKIDFPNGAPSQSDIDTVIQAHEHDKKSKAKKQKRDSAVNKLKGLGLTKEEIEALIP